MTTALFVAICWLVVINTVYRYPGNTLIGLGILLAGIPAFYFSVLVLRAGRPYHRAPFVYLSNSAAARLLR